MILYSTAFTDYKSQIELAAGISTVIALAILWAIQPLERRYSRRFKQKTLKIVSSLDVDTMELLRKLLNGDELKFQSFTINRDEDEFILELKFDDIDMTKIIGGINELKKDTTIKEIFWYQ